MRVMRSMGNRECMKIAASFALSPAPPVPLGPEEMDAKEKLNPMSKIRQTQLLFPAHWPRGLWVGGGEEH